VNTVEQPRKRAAVLGRFAALPLVLGCCAAKEEIGLCAAAGEGEDGLGLFVGRWSWSARPWAWVMRKEEAQAREVELLKERIWGDQVNQF